MTNPQSLNQYTYCENNPVMFVDPTGQSASKSSMQKEPEGGSTASISAGGGGGGGRTSGLGALVVPALNAAANTLANPTLQAEIDQAAASGSPIDLVTIGIPVDDLLDAGKAVLKGLKGFGVLTKASKYGIKPYNALVKSLKGTGLEAHHILEKRFANIAGVLNSKLMLSVAVTETEHQAFTNAWRRYIPYGTDYSTLSKEDLWSIAQRVYKGYPELIEAVRKTIYE